MRNRELNTNTGREQRYAEPIDEQAEAKRRAVEDFSRGRQDALDGKRLIPMIANRSPEYIKGWTSGQLSKTRSIDRFDMSLY